MKKLFFLLGFLFVMSSVMAQVIPALATTAPVTTDSAVAPATSSTGILQDLANWKITTEQAILHPYNQKGGFSQATMFPLVTAASVTGKYAWLITPWKFDAGVNYGNVPVGIVPIAIGYDIGNLASYLPAEFPLSKYVSFTIYPFQETGKWSQHPKLKPGYGVAYLKISFQS